MNEPRALAIKRRKLAASTAYAVAIAGVVIMWALRTALEPALGNLQPFAPFLFIVLLVGWWCGTGPAILTTVLAFLAADYFFMVPRHALFEGGLPEFAGGLVFLLIAAGIIIVTAQIRRTKQRLQDDIAERKRAEGALAEAEARLRLALSAGRIGIWENNYTKGETRLSDIALELFGFPRTAAPVQSIEEVRRRFHPEDRDRVLDQVYDALEQTQEYVCEFRVPRPDGSVRWLLAKGSTAVPQTPGGAQAVGAIVDITERKEASEAVRHSQERLEQLIRDAPVALAMFDRNMRYLRVSNRWLQTVNLGTQEIIGKSHYELFPNLAEHWKAAHRRGLAGEPSSGEDEWKTPDGRTLALRWEVHPWGDTGVQTGGIILFLEDITERKRAEKTLRESETRFRTLADNMSQLAWMADEKGWLFWYNRRWYEYTGTNLEEMQGWGWRAVHHPEHRERVLEKYRQHIQTGEEWEDTFPLRGHDGNYRWFLSRAVPIKDEQGKVTRWLGTNTDITEQKQAEAALRQSEERYRSFVEASAQVIWRTNERGEVDEPIPSWNAFTGQIDSEAMGFGWMNAIHPEDRPRVVQAWKQASESRSLYEVEYRLKDRTGRWRHIRARGVPVLEADGEVREYIGTCIDITDQRKVESELRESRATLVAALASMQDAVFIADAHGGFIEYNEAFATFHRFPGKSSCPKTLAEYPDVLEIALPGGKPVPLQDWPMHRALRGETGTNAVFKLRRKDTAETWFGSYSFSPILNKEGAIVGSVVVARDITEERHAQEAVERQARLIDLAPAATLVRTLEGTITFWSDGAAGLYGWSREEALGRNSHELLHTEFPVEFGAILGALRSGGRWSGTLRHRTKSGQAVVVESHWLGQFTAAGEFTEVLESNMDITERERTADELKRLKGDLEVRVERRTAQLMEANQELEAFGYSVSHDLRAPLRHIDSYLTLLQANAVLDEKSQRYLRIVVEAAKRMGNLIDDLLVLSRLSRVGMERRTVNLAQLVEEVWHELAPATAGRAVQWRVGQLPRVHGDPNLLRSAVTNLLSNAIKYSRERNPAVIEVGSHMENGEVICYVRDNGAGFDMRFADKLFGVFQRLHSSREFEGTGIGLASVRRVVQRHGGRTWAEAEPGKGATFYFSLPKGDSGPKRDD